MNTQTSLVTQVAGTVQSAAEATANTALAAVTPESKTDALIGSTAAWLMAGQTYLLAPTVINYIGEAAVRRPFQAFLGNGAGQLAGRVLGPFAAAYMAPTAYATAVPLAAFAISSVTGVIALNALKLTRRVASKLFDYFSRNKGIMTVHQDQVSEEALKEKAYLNLGIVPNSSPAAVRKAFNLNSRGFYN